MILYLKNGKLLNLPNFYVYSKENSLHLMLLISFSFFIYVDSVCFVYTSIESMNKHIYIYIQAE